MKIFPAKAFYDSFCRLGQGCRRVVVTDCRIAETQYNLNIMRRRIGDAKAFPCRNICNVGGGRAFRITGHMEAKTHKRIVSRRTLVQSKGSADSAAVVNDRVKSVIMDFVPRFDRPINSGSAAIGVVTIEESVTAVFVGFVESSIDLVNAIRSIPAEQATLGNAQVRSQRNT